MTLWGGSVVENVVQALARIIVGEQMLSAVQLRRGDGGWVIGRRASQSAVCAAVAAALCTHYATRPETDIDILVG